MEANTKLYLVSFGDSNQYRLEVPAADKNHDLVDIEKELTDYLTSLYPGQTFAYFTSPKVVELAPEHRSQFEQHPPLDAAAVKEIEAVLKTEVLNRADQNQLDANAPFNDVAPTY